MKYDLEERTAKYGEVIIDFVKTLRKEDIFVSIIIQLVKSGTSIGANYCEANQASSKRIFKIKFIFVKKKQMRLNIGLE